MPFVSIEGIDGCGKTTQVELLCGALKAAGKVVVRTKEPDGGRLGTEIRTVLTKGGRLLSSIEEFLLISAARCDHVHSIIRPALDAGAWVVSDRFVDSSYALQAYGDADVTAIFEAVNSKVVADVVPDVTFLLDLPEVEAQRRRDLRADAHRDPAEHTRNFSTIRAGFLESARRSESRSYILNGMQGKMEIAKEIWLLVRAKWPGVSA